MRQVMEELETPPLPNDDVGLGLFVTDFEGPLADCVVRLVRLLATPKAIPVLYPAIMREISFWLLTGKNGGEVAKVVLPNSRTRRLAEAIQILRDDYVRPIRIDELASVAHMSPSSFHQHFKTLTSMTPLQYQKQLRLLAARRLMTASGINVAAAAYQVGYESASQFSREYARMFGMPPKRDVMRMEIGAAGARAMTLDDDAGPNSEVVASSASLDSATEIKTSCAIVGAGPAGLMLGLVLARGGVDVTVIEKHGDFLRDFRGDTIHPSTLQVMHELGLADELLKLPHTEARTLHAEVGGKNITIADFSLVADEEPFHRLHAAVGLPRFPYARGKALSEFSAADAD